DGAAAFPGEPDELALGLGEQDERAVAVDLAFVDVGEAAQADAFGGQHEAGLPVLVDDRVARVPDPQRQAGDTRNGICSGGMNIHLSASSRQAGGPTRTPTV